MFEILTKYYGWIIFIMGTIIIVEQTREHQLIGIQSDQDVVFYYGEIIFFLLLLVLIGLLIRRLLKALAEKSQAINILKLKQTFVSKLSTSRGIPELAKSMVRQVAIIVPDVGIELYINEANKDWFIRVNHTGLNTDIQNSNDLPENIEAFPCADCLINNNGRIGSLRTCQRPEHTLDLENQAGYCLPLVYGASPIGLLLLYFPKNNAISTEQMELLDNVSGEMSNAIGMVMEIQAREEARVTEKIQSVQLDIARDLHDTVGQNIGYLRMQLDNLTEKNIDGQSDLIMEIRSMSRVANESYDLVRGTLAVLQADNSADLLYMFSRYAEQIAERSNFKINFKNTGTPKTLTAGRLRHLFYIFREALSNIEKHAHAKLVDVEFTWDAKNLTLVIFDDGNGYDLARTQKVDAHYGLKFMRERAIILNGSIKVTSEIGIGTKIKVIVPCDEK